MKGLRHPIPTLAGVAVTVGIALRALFLWKATWLWSFARPFRSREITPWARGAMGDRDGAEPYALIALVLLQLLLTVGGMALLARLAPLARRVPARARDALAVLLPLAALLTLAQLVPTHAPWPEVAADRRAAVAVVAGALLATLGVRWAMRRQAGGAGSPAAGAPAGIPAVVAAVLVPICFISTTLPSLLDLPTILAPAMRLANGFPPSAVYLQYDLFPSLLAIAWRKLGGTPYGFSLVVGASYYAMLVGLFWLARRLFARGDLAAPLLVALVVVRIYGVLIDANATPQATPMRLDLWPILVAVTLAYGLEHWSVGVVLGALFLCSRSMGTLYLGAYGLALVADFLARRRAAAAAAASAARPPLAQEVRAQARRLGPALAAIGLAMLVTRRVFGSFGSDAVRLYRELGVGMMRTGAGSFYWWLLPLTGAAGWLVYARRAERPARPAQAGIFTVALLVANSLYFFGRSHEHNLINISASFLFCFFLALDRSWPAAPTADAARGAVAVAGPVADADANANSGARALAWILRAVPWLLVAGCAYYYSGRVVPKLAAQLTVAEGARPLPPAFPYDVLPAINCMEIARASVDSRVYFFSKNDFWYYQTCGVVPQGFIQPLFLAIRTQDVVAQVNGVLDSGFKVVVPKNRDWSAGFAEILPALGNPELIETPQYRLYRRAVAPGGAHKP